MPVDPLSVVAGPFTPDGVLTTWSFPFAATDASEIAPVLVAPDGGMSTPAHTVNLVTKEVTITPAPTAAQGTLYLTWAPAFGQDVTFEDQARFSPTVMNRALDLAVVRDRYLKSLLDRAVLGPLGSSGADAGEIIAGINDAAQQQMAEVGDAVETAISARLHLQAETLDWVAACATAGATPTFPRLLLMDDLVVRLKAAGAFSWASGLFIAGESKAQTLVNIVRPAVAAQEMVVSGAPLGFVADRYLEGTGHAYVDTNIALPDARFTQNSAFLYVCQVNNLRNNISRMIGSRSGKSWLVPATGRLSRVRLQANAGNDALGGTLLSNGVGAFGWIRREAGRVQTMLGGEVADVISSASIPINTVGNEMLLLRAGGLYGLGRAFAFAFGAAPTDTQYAAMADAIEAYGRQLGALI